MDIEQGKPKWADARAPRSLDRVLLDEANHRVANEVTSALAALRLAQSSKGQRSRQRMIEIAIDRLEGFGECSRMLAGLSLAETDAGNLVEQLCRAMIRSRIAFVPDRVLLDLGRLVVDGETARRIAMIAYELIMNALKHAFPVGGGELEIRLKKLGNNIVLSIIDDGPGLLQSSVATTAGLGGRIVKELVRASSGIIECETGPHGTVVHVMLPNGAPA